MNVSKPSKFWPWIKGAAKLLGHVKIPGTDLTAKAVLDALIGVQDDLAKFQWDEKKDVKPALNALRDNAALIAEALRRHGGDFTAAQLGDEADALAERLYLADTAREFLYADFKGIEQDVRWVSLELDDVFVELKFRPEKADDRRLAAEEELRERLLAAEADQREPLERELEEREASPAGRSSRRFRSRGARARFGIVSPCVNEATAREDETRLQTDRPTYEANGA
jgi:hypothetical protein